MDERIVFPGTYSICKTKYNTLKGGHSNERDHQNIGGAAGRRNVDRRHIRSGTGEMRTPYQMRSDHGVCGLLWTAYAYTEAAASAAWGMRVRSTITEDVPMDMAIIIDRRRSRKAAGDTI